MTQDEYPLVRFHGWLPKSGECPKFSTPTFKYFFSIYVLITMAQRIYLYISDKRFTYATKISNDMELNGSVNQLFPLALEALRIIVEHGHPDTEVMDGWNDFVANYQKFLVEKRKK